MSTAPQTNSPSVQFNLETDPIHIWHIPLSDVNLPTQSNNILSKTEEERANRIRIPEARDQYVKTRSAMRMILAMYLKQPPENIDFGYSDYQKPYVLDNPYGIEFNITHSSTYALCVIAQNRFVGIDIEKVKPLNDLEQLVTNIFTSDELYDFTKKSHDEKLLYFYRAWSRKEAFVKAQGKGFFHPVNELDLASLSSEEQSTLILPDIAGENCHWTFNDFSIKSNKEQYQACVFWQGQKENIAYHQVNDLPKSSV